MEFRNYKKEDAEEIIKWIRNEQELFLWSADIYNKFPIEAEDINNFYKGCSKKTNFYPMTLIENNKIIGHLILRNVSENNKIIRLGFIIVNPILRGKGYGKKLINYAIEYAENNLNAGEINLGVFENNINAYKCYKSVGFAEINKEEIYTINNEKWKCIELIYKKEV